MADFHPDFEPIEAPEESSFHPDFEPISQDSSSGMSPDKAKMIASQNIVDRARAAGQNDIYTNRELGVPGEGFLNKQQAFEQLSPIKSTITKYGRPLLEMGGMIAGGVAATPADVVAGPVPTVAGAGLGYGLGVKGADLLDIAMGSPQADIRAKQPISTQAINTANDVLQGATMEMGGAAASVPIGVAMRGASGILASSSEKNVAKALQPTTLENKAITENITPQILEDKTFAFTKAGLEKKAAAGREAAGEAIGNYGKLEGEVNPQQVVQRLDQERAKYIVEGKPINQQAIDRIDKLKDVFVQYGDSIPTEGMREIYRMFGSEVKAGKGFFGKTLEEGSNLDLKKIAVDDMRRIITDQHPDLVKLNQAYSFYAKLDDVISATNQRTASQGRGKDMAAAGIGILSGHTVPSMVMKAASFKWAMEAIQSPGWQLASAHLKNRLARALAVDDFGTVYNQSTKAIFGLPKNLSEGAPVQAVVEGKHYATEFMGKVGDKYKVKLRDGKIKVVSGDQIGPVGSINPKTNQTGVTTIEHEGIPANTIFKFKDTLPGTVKNPSGTYLVEINGKEVEIPINKAKGINTDTPPSI